MVAQTFIAWAKAILHAIVIPAALCGFLPYGWVVAIVYLAVASYLYATVLGNRPAALPFMALAAIIALIVIPAYLTLELIDSAAVLEDRRISR